MKKNKVFWILSAIILLHLILISMFINQSFYGDETGFIVGAREIASGKITGPLGYRDGVLDSYKSNMLAHPPTFVYLLALFIKLFGSSAISVRSLSALFSIGIIILIYLITKLILEKKKIDNSTNLALFASLLYAIMPIAVQSSIIVDIDGGILNFFVLLFLYFYLSEKKEAYIISALFFVFMSKISAPVALFAALFLLNLILSDYKELLRIIKIFIIAGLAAFLIIVAYGKIFDLNWIDIFNHNSIFYFLMYFIKNPYEITFKALWFFKIFFYFATPFFIFLFIFVIFLILKKIYHRKINYIKENKDMFVLLFYALLSIALILICGVTGYNFPKYYIATVVPILVALIYFSSEINLKDYLKKYWKILLLTSILILAYYAIFLKDPLIPEIEGRVKTTSLMDAVKPILTRSIMYSIVPLFLSLGLFIVIKEKRLWFILFFLFILTTLYIQAIQLRANYSTHVIYGDKGLQEVLEFMKGKPPNQIMGYPHVIYYIDYKNCYELTSVYFNLPKFQELINTKSINWIILYPKDMVLLKEELDDFEVEKNIGSYIILKRK